MRMLPVEVAAITEFSLLLALQHLVPFVFGAVLWCCFSVFAKDVLVAIPRTSTAAIELGRYAPITLM